MIIVKILLALLGLFFVGSLLGRHLKRQRRALGDLACTPDNRLDISDLVHRVPAKVRRGV